jgi:hypothetical protein
LIEVELAEVDAGPSAEQRQLSFIVELLQILIIRLRDRGFGIARDDLRVQKKEQILRASALLARSLPRVADIAAEYGLASEPVACRACRRIASADKLLPLGANQAGCSIIWREYSLRSLMS